MTLEERVQRLEDDRAIRDLKARYLRACDGKDPATIRETMLPDAKVLYDGFPPFDSRDDFIAIYEQFGCQPGIYDIHHIANGIVTFESPERARGQFSLYFHNVNLTSRTLTQFGVEYDDIYVKQGGRWWIAETRSRRTSCMIHSVDTEGGVKVVTMGEPPAVFGE